MSTTIQPTYLYEPYGFMTENEMTRQCLNAKNRTRIHDIAVNLKMPKNTFLSVNQNGIKLERVSSKKSVPYNLGFTKAIDGPTIPFNLTESKNNLEKFYAKFESACKQAIKKGRIKTLIKNLLAK